MKRDFLKQLGLEDAVVDAVMAEHGKAMETQKQQNATLSAERDGLRTQLDAASAEIKSYKDMDIEGIRKAAKDWEQKYREETTRLQSQMDELQYSYTVKDAASGMKFTSDSAKRAFVHDLTAKQLSVQDGKLLGFDDFVAQYKQTDPGAFAPEKEEPTAYAVRGTGGNGNTPGTDALRAAFGLK